MTFTDQIIEKCDCSQGMTLSQLASALNRKCHDVNSMAGLLSKQGRIYKAGVRRHYRYFKLEAHAQAWQKIAQQEYERTTTAARLKAREDRNAARRKGNPPGRPRNAQNATPTAHSSAAKPNRYVPPEIRQTKPAPTMEPAPPVQEVWPDDLKIQVIPTPPGRFAVNPPEGWKGQITCDWMDRRLREVNNASMSTRTR